MHLKILKVTPRLGVVVHSLCSARQSSSANQVGAKYGYVKENDVEVKTDIEGQLHVGISTLPQKLQDSLSEFYKIHPSKRTRNDGLQLQRHLLNRGRPTSTTWSKYKNARQKGKLTIRANVKQFSMEEAIKEGLVQPDNIEEETIEEEVDENTEEKKPQIKRPSKSQYTVIRYGSRETAAYIASRVPSVYGTTYRALHEIKRRDPEFKPGTLLDFGSGTGMTVWAANEIWGDSIFEYQCVDASEKMNEAAEFLLRGSRDYNKNLKIPNVFFKRFLPFSNQVMYDIVVSSYSLTEMPFRKQRVQAIKSLWEKTNKFLVLVEPGTNEGFEAVLQARQYVTESKITDTDNIVAEETDFKSMFEEFNIDSDSPIEEGHVFAPCPHEQICARAYMETRDHPCSFTQKVPLSFSQKYTPLKNYGYHDEKFSFVIIKKGKEGLNNNDEKVAWTRILKPVVARKNHVLCELCCSNGNIEKHILTKAKDPQIYKATRHRLKQGDMVPLDNMKRPMNVRRAIKPIKYHPKQHSNQSQDAKNQIKKSCN